MSFLDILIISLVVSFSLVGAVWGVIRQVIALGGLLVGIWLASTFNSNVAAMLGVINNPQVARGVAFILIVIGVSFVASLIASILYFVVGLLFLGWLDHLLGAGLGFIQGLLSVGIVLVGLLTLSPDWTQQQLAQSFLADKVASGLTGLTLLPAPPELKEIIERAIPRR